MLLSADHPVAHPGRHAPHTDSSRRRWVLCAVALVLLLAHQALAARDHRGPANRSAAPGTSAGTPDAAAGPDGPDAPATLRGACPAHQGTLPLPPLGGGDPPLVAGHADVPAAAPLRTWPPPRCADNPRRRRALLQVFRN